MQCGHLIAINITCKLDIGWAIDKVNNKKLWCISANRISNYLILKINKAFNKRPKYTKKQLEKVQKKHYWLNYEKNEFVIQMIIQLS